MCLRSLSPAALVAVLLVLHSQAAPAQVPGALTVDPEVEATVAEIFAEWNRAGSPGCAVGVYRAGELVFARGFGEANLDWGIPIDPFTTVFYSGSVSKQFTAAVAALMHLDGTIDLDADVREWIPELPVYDPPVLVRHLVQHTSGVRDIYGLISLSGGNVADAWSDAAYLELLARQTTLNHPAGSDYLYSNGAYYLLTTVLERAGGKRLDDLARAYIFGPLGMGDTHFHQDVGRIVPRRALSYGGTAESGFRQTYLSNFDKSGAGGLYTTIRDLAAWDRNFSTGEVGGEAFLRLMHTPGVLTGGDTISYAFGLQFGRSLGRRTVGHGGSFMGFRADYVRYPEDALSVAALCNLGGINPGPLTRRVATAILEPETLAGTGEAAEAPGQAAGQDAASPRPSPPPFPLAALIGAFYSPEVDATVRVRLEGEELRVSGAGRASEVPLRHVDGARFQAPGWSFEVEAVDGRAAALVLDAGRVRNLRFERTDER